MLTTALAAWTALSLPAGIGVAAVIRRADQHRTRDLQAAMRRHPAGKQAGR